MQFGVEWKFNLEKAPWWGGLLKRLVRVTKRCLRKMVGQARLSYDEMHTAIVEVEAVINSRPLTFLNAEDIEQPLTLSHFCAKGDFWIYRTILLIMWMRIPTLKSTVKPCRRDCDIWQAF